MSKNKINLYAKKYIDTVFAQRLLDSGFVSPDDQHLCWYRIKENGLVNSITFFSRWRNIPVHLEVGFGIHTLFHRPVYTRTIDYKQRPLFINELFYEKMLVENCPVNEMCYMPYSGDLPIIAPGRDGRGFYTIDGIIIPLMDSVTTVEECYRLHKKWYQDLRYNSMEEKFFSISQVFVDEAIYLNDSEVYPYCVKRAHRAINYWKERCETVPDNKENIKSLYEWELRAGALSTGERAGYIEHMEKRKQENLQFLKKRLRILPP